MSKMRIQQTYLAVIPEFASISNTKQLLINSLLHLTNLDEPIELDSSRSRFQFFGINTRRYCRIIGFLAVMDIY